MTYVKKLIDNTVCSRRFHLTYDDRDPKQAKVTLNCPFCGIKIFEATDHPPVNLARQENLIQTAELSDDIITQCAFEDELSKRTMPHSLQQSIPH